MNAWVNYDDIFDQLQGAGFDLTDLDVGRMRKVPVAGCTQKGWYSLHEIRLDDGREALVGAYGWWKGAEKFQFNFELRVGSDKPSLSKEQKAAIKLRMAEARKQAEASKARESARAGEEASRAWSKYSPLPGGSTAPGTPSGWPGTWRT